jgi:DNA polymerase III delta subunit
MVENNTFSLKQESLRLMLFLDKTQKVTEDTITKWLTHSKVENAFNLYTAIANADFERSIEIVHALLGAKNPAQAIFAALNYSFKRLCDYIDIVQNEGGSETAFRNSGFASPIQRKDHEAMYRTYKKRCGAEAVIGSLGEKCLALSSEFDLLLRQSPSVLEEIIMDYYIYSLFRIRV